MPDRISKTLSKIPNAWAVPSTLFDLVRSCSKWSKCKYYIVYRGDIRLYYALGGSTVRQAGQGPFSNRI